MSVELKTQPDQLSDSEIQLQCLSTVASAVPFREKLMEVGLLPLVSSGISVMQVNLGKVCNLSCKHCHVGAGPDRTESMSRETAASCLAVLDRTGIPALDITGGAPELNPNLTWLIEEAVRLGRKVMVRTNLTVLEQKGYAQLAQFYASHRVELIASLPYYFGRNTDRQRGDGVFESSIRVLQQLNKLGYGLKDNQLLLNLVYNPGGAYLPPAQHAVEADFKRELARRYGISFNRLFTITNVPVGRFLSFLTGSGNLEEYMIRLSGAFNPAAAGQVMCRSQISVGWDGRLYDCDFNQTLNLPCAPESSRHIDDFNMDTLSSRRIITDNHCYACTAGSGSSCGGAVVV